MKKKKHCTTRPKKIEREGEEQRNDGDDWGCMKIFSRDPYVRLYKRNSGTQIFNNRLLRSVFFLLLFASRLFANLTRQMFRELGVPLRKHDELSNQEIFQLHLHLTHFSHPFPPPPRLSNTSTVFFFFSLGLGNMISPSLCETPVGSREQQVPVESLLTAARCCLLRLW